MSVNRLVQALRCEFLPDLSADFLSDCLDWNVHLTAVDVTVLFSRRENAIAKEPGSSYHKPWRCVFRLGW